LDRAKVKPPLGQRLPTTAAAKSTIWSLLYYGVSVMPKFELCVVWGMDSSVRDSELELSRYAFATLEEQKAFLQGALEAAQRGGLKFLPFPKEMEKDFRELMREGCAEPRT
jgi:hypothetical protein